MGKGVPAFLSRVIVALCCVLLLLAFVVPMLKVSADSNPQILISPTSAKMAKGDSFSVTVNLTDDSDLFCYQVVLEYNGSVLNLTDISVPDYGVFAGHNYVAPSEPTDKEAAGDYVTGLNWTLGGASLLGADNVSVTNGVLFTANFTAVAAGVTTITLMTYANPVIAGGTSGSPIHDTFYTFVWDPNFVEYNGFQTVGCTVTVNQPALYITATSGGTTDPEPGSYSYPVNTTVSVEAIAESEHNFNYWELDGVNVGSQNPYNVTMYTDHTLNAVFSWRPPKTWTVAQSGPADFQAIQDAIDSPQVVYGDTIFVKSGTYIENIFGSKNLTIIGENKWTTIIDGNGTGTVVTVAYEADFNQSSRTYFNPSCLTDLEGFTIRNGEYGIQTFNPNDFSLCSTIKDNIVVDNAIGGIQIGDMPEFNEYGNISLMNNEVSNNTLFGIYLRASKGNTLINNTVADNGEGIVLNFPFDGNTFENNTIANNTYNFGFSKEAENWVSPSNMISSNDVDTSNTVDGKPIYFLTGLTGYSISNDAGYVLLYNCTGVTVSHCSLQNNIQAIWLLYSNNTFISQNQIAHNVYGIWSVSSMNNTLTDNTLEDNVHGVYLDWGSNETTMRNNVLNGNSMAFGLSRSWLYNLESNDIDESNTIDEKPMVYWVNQHGGNISAEAGCVWLVNSSDITLTGLNLSGNVQDIGVFGSQNITISNCTIANAVYGIYAGTLYDWNRTFTSLTTLIANTSCVTVENCSFVSNCVGVLLQGCNCSRVSDSSMSGEAAAVSAPFSDNCVVSGNTIDCDLNVSMFETRGYPYWDLTYSPIDGELTAEFLELNWGGILAGGYNDMIFGNTVMNGFNGISLFVQVYNARCSNSTAFHNNLINDTYPGISEPPFGSGIHWDNGVEGNYWSNYTGTDLDHDGVGDTAFIIHYTPSLGVIDRYPLMGMFESFSTNSGMQGVQVFSNSTITGFHSSGGMISFNVSGLAGTAGFCRIGVPTAVINGTLRVFINGTEVAYTTLPISNDTYTYLYLNYTHSTEQIIIIPEFQAFPILLMLALSAALMATVYKKKAQKSK